MNTLGRRNFQTTPQPKPSPNQFALFQFTNARVVHRPNPQTRCWHEISNSFPCRPFLFTSPTRTSSARNPKAKAPVKNNQLGTMDRHKLSWRLPPATGAIAHAMPTSTQTHAGVPPNDPVSLTPSTPLPLLLRPPAASEETARHIMWDSDQDRKHSSDMPSQARLVSRQNAFTRTNERTSTPTEMDRDEGWR